MIVPVLQHYPISKTKMLSAMNWKTMTAIWLALSVSGCAMLGPKGPDEVQPSVEHRFLGRPVQEMVAAYGQPARVEIQYGHYVYYWVQITARSYTPTYTANTQGYVGNTPYSSTTTMQGDTQGFVGPSCTLSAGTDVDSDRVIKMQVRGFDCGLFLRN